jgi:hypothetical protein
VELDVEEDVDVVEELAPGSGGESDFELHAAKTRPPSKLEPRRSVDATGNLLAFDM